MALVALLSNPRSTGNRTILPRVRSFCARHGDIFHYEVESVEQIGAALRTIARVGPRILVINGGDDRVTLEWAPEVVSAAADADWTIDPNGYLAPLGVMLTATEDD